MAVESGGSVDFDLFKAENQSTPHLFFGLFLSNESPELLIFQHFCSNRTAILMKIENLCFFFIQIFARRCLATSAKPATKEDPKQATKKNAAQTPNYSFITNAFRGVVEPSQAFPYPNYLNEEQNELIAAMVDPVTKFFTVSPFNKRPCGPHNSFHSLVGSKRPGEE